MTKPELLAACVGGISFCDEMVQQLPPRGIKGRTMRVMKPQPGDCTLCGAEMAFAEFPLLGDRWIALYACMECDAERQAPAPKYKVGDIVYVQEEWGYNTHNGGMEIIYRSDVKSRYEKSVMSIIDRWHSAEEMPPEYARTFILITEVKAQMPQELTVEEILDEGLQCRFPGAEEPDCKTCYLRNVVGCVMHDKWAHLWNSLYPEQDLPLYGYEANPLCWTYLFERVVPDD